MTPWGRLSDAAVAGPPSPASAAVPLPASVVIVPGAACALAPSAAQIEAAHAPAASTDRPRRCVPLRPSRTPWLFPTRPKSAGGGMRYGDSGPAPAVGAKCEHLGFPLVFCAARIAQREHH